MHRAVCLFTSQLSLVLIAPTHGEMARLGLPSFSFSSSDDDDDDDDDDDISYIS